MVHKSGSNPAISIEIMAAFPWSFAPCHEFISIVGTVVQTAKLEHRTSSPLGSSDHTAFAVETLLSVAVSSHSDFRSLTQRVAYFHGSHFWGRVGDIVNSVGDIGIFPRCSWC